MTFKIEAEFEDAETLAEALEYIGAADATFAPTHGVITIEDDLYALWSGHDAALAACRARTGDGATSPTGLGQVSGDHCR